MTNMATQNPLVDLRDRFDTIRPVLETVFQDDSDALQRVRETAAKLQRDADSGRLNTLVFGHYNAGKSTFINALLGQEVAPMGDVPLTARIERYEWQGHLLYDSPGIDAPIEHEAVTDEFIERECNAVVYVIATGGGIEEAATWQRLCGFVRQKKAVLVVVNDKSGFELNGMDFARIRDTVYENMQLAARQLGIADALDGVQVLHVKARTALKARLEGKPGLLQKSGLLEAETELRRFLQASTEKVLASDRERARAIVNEAVSALSQDAGGEAGRQLAACRNEVETERRRLESALVEAVRSLVAREIESLERTVGAIDGQSTDLQSLLNGALERSQERLAVGVEKQLDAELQRSEGVVRRATEVLRQQMRVAQVGIDAVELKAGGAAPTSQDGPAEGGYDIAAELLQKAQGVGVDDMTQTGVKYLLEQGKKLLPELFKGIGPKTIGKWAGMAGRAAGPLLMALQSAYELYRAGKDDSRARERHSRFVASVMATARQAFKDTADQYELVLQRVASAAFDPVVQALDRRALELATASDAQKATREQLAAWTRSLAS